MTTPVPERTYEESCALLDEIVGQCVREPDFGAQVLDNPVTALAAYELHEHEMDDFRTLRRDHREEAATGWAQIRTAMVGRR